jgi:hypothetical protein
MRAQDSARSYESRVPTIHAYRPYRSAALVTGESVQLVSLSRRDGGNAETLEEMLRRLRELCRLMAYVSALEAAAANGDRDVVKRSADAHTLLEAMFRRAADDLQHVARTMPGAIANWQPPPCESS